MKQERNEDGYESTVINKVDIAKPFGNVSSWGRQE